MNLPGPEKRERKFVLDCVAVSSVARGYEQTRPRLWSVLPQYDARNDPHAERYMTIPTVQKILNRTGTKEQRGTAAQKSLELRNAIGAGHSLEQVSNHGGLMSHTKPLTGYNGEFGFRRNTPSLRQKPSSFGEVTSFPLY